VRTAEKYFPYTLNKTLKCTGCILMKYTLLSPNTITVKHKSELHAGSHQCLTENLVFP